MAATNNIGKLVRQEVRDLNAYHVENIPCPVVLDANENPFPLSDELKEEVLRALGGVKTNRYPDTGSVRLKEAIARRDGVFANQILLGNGSDEIIQMILTVFCEKGAKVLFPVPTFSMYALIARAWGGIPVECPLNARWDIDIASFLKKMETEDPAVIFLSTPNNPTGNMFSTGSILEILNHGSGIVVVDEAYIHFAEKTFADRLKEFPNLIILRSLSKVGMAALRLGYAIASPEIIDFLNRVRLPYNINSLSQAAAEVVLNKWEVMEEQIEALKAERARIFGVLEKINGIHPFPSMSNFILFRLEEGREEPTVFFKNLIGKGIRIRNLSNVPFLERCFRVTIGTAEENDAFLKALRDQ